MMPREVSFQTVVTLPDFFFFTSSCVFHFQTNHNGSASLSVHNNISLFKHKNTAGYMVRCREIHLFLDTNFFIHCVLGLGIINDDIELGRVAGTRVQLLPTPS